MNATPHLITALLLITFACPAQHFYSGLFPGASSPEKVKEPGPNIMVVFQDSKQVYWFGSWESGLYRYDGKSILHYTTKQGLPADRIDQIQEDRSGNLYFVSCHPRAVVTQFDGKQFRVLSPLADNNWKLQDQDLWLESAYSSGKVFRFDGSVLHELTLPGPAQYKRRFEIYSIYKDRKGNIWFGTNPLGVCRYNGTSFDWITEDDVTEFREGGANGVRSITEDKQGDFWFNTEYRYQVYGVPAAKQQPFYVRHPAIGSLDGKKNGNCNEFLSTLRDDQGNLWFVTYREGVWRYDGSTLKHFTVQEQGNNIELYSIYKDHKGDLWLGTHKNGLYRFNGKTFVPFRP